MNIFNALVIASMMSTSMAAMAEGGSEKLKEKTAATQHASMENTSPSKQTEALATVQAATKNDTV
ncbi:MAG: hypothetical protein JWP80_1915 [Pseudomonas sp.]|nr:hypothetical protein [Pseudomonas sp.]